VAGIAVLLLRAGWRRAGRQRAMLTGLAAGLVYGISDALTRVVTVQLSGGHSLVHVLTTWPVYSLVAASVAGLWLMESSFNAGPLNASLPAITAAEPVAGICLGVIVLGDVVRTSPGLLALQGAGVVALVVGVVLVARAPMLASLRTLPHPSLPAMPHPTMPSLPALAQPVLPAAREVLERLTPARAGGPVVAPQSPEA
jgi:hypothetical protein